MTIIRTGNGDVVDKNNPLPTIGIEQEHIAPVSIQDRYAQTIQTHNAVSVGATNGASDSAWVDCSGFSEVAFTLLNDAGTNTAVDVHWSHDGVAQHGYEQLLAVANQQRRAGQVPIKAKYVRFRVMNTDASSHTMSAWAYLKS